MVRFLREKRAASGCPVPRRLEAGGALSGRVPGTGARRAAAVLLAAFALVLSSCGEKDPAWEGDDLVKSAREHYVSLDSARLEIRDDSSMETKTSFTFRYEGNTLHYVFEGTYNGQPYYEYHDGSRLWIQKEGQVSSYGWSLMKNGYQKYTRKDRHPNADAGILFFEPKAIVSVEQSVGIETGTKAFLYEYDVDKLGKAASLASDGSTLTSFTTTYFFEPSGKFAYLTETSVMSGQEGESSSSYTITIRDENAVEALQNPIDIQE